MTNENDTVNVLARRLDSLPKWAQSHITNLERQAKEARQEADNMPKKEPRISDLVIIVDTDKKVRPYSTDHGDRTFLTTDLALAHARDRALETGDPHIITPHRGGTRWKVQRAQKKEGTTS